MTAPKPAPKRISYYIDYRLPLRSGQMLLTVPVPMPPEDYDTIMEYMRLARPAFAPEPISEVPCCRCGGKVIEFSIPNELWNAIVRKNGPETDQEYLCVQCFAEIAAEWANERKQTDEQA